VKELNLRDYAFNMKIGLLSDTHGYLDPKVVRHFQACEEIWHAGDIGNAEVADALEKFKPLRAVYGNIDDKILQSRFQEDLRFTCEQLTVWITHIGGTPPSYTPRIKKALQTNAPDIFICGHSHILRIKRDANFNNMLFLNPGAAGNQGFHSIKTIVRFEILGREVRNMEVIELGKRGQIQPNE
jgi:putative phosphoesterase